MKSVTGPTFLNLGIPEMMNASINALMYKPVDVKIDYYITEPLKVPDVSFWQGEIDWGRMWEKTKNAIIRAGQRRWTDTQFIRNWVQAKLRNIRRGVYWYYDGAEIPKRQASILYGLIQNDLPELGIWIDWESSTNAKYDGLRNVVLMMQALEESLPGIEIGMYTGYYFMLTNSNGIMNAREYKYLKRKRLWLAQYNVYGTKLRIPPPWTPEMVELHQFGTPTEGRDYGCMSKEIDMSHVISNFPKYDTTSLLQGV